VYWGLNIRPLLVILGIRVQGLGFSMHWGLNIRPLRLRAYASLRVLGILLKIDFWGVSGGFQHALDPLDLVPSTCEHRGLLIRILVRCLASYGAWNPAPVKIMS
jgi:hypothetical protein